VFTQGMPWFRARIGHFALDLLCCGALSCVTLASALAQTPEEPMRVQLNKLETIGEACQATLMFENTRATPIKSFKLDLYAFDTDGVAQKRMLLDLGPVPAHKVKMRPFEVAATPCAQVGKLLINDVAACEGADLTRETCLERVEPTSAKGAVPFVR
jgi:hypothetical protein